MKLISQKNYPCGYLWRKKKMKKIITSGKNLNCEQLPDDFWGNISRACESVSEKREMIMLLFEPEEIHYFKDALMRFFKVEKKATPHEHGWILGTITDMIKRGLTGIERNISNYGIGVVVVSCDLSKELNDPYFLVGATMNDLAIWIRPI